MSLTWSHSHCDLRFHTKFLFCTRLEAFGMSNSFQFLSYYLHELSLSLFIMFPIAKSINSVFKPANPHPSFSFSDLFHVSRYSVMFTSLPPQGSPTISSANIIDSGSYFLTPYVIVHGPDKNLVPPRGTKAHMFSHQEKYCGTKRTKVRILQKLIRL